jgi:NADH dehydrogenase
VADELNVVTGAFGFTGRYITSQLLAQGKKVRTLTNHPANPSPFADKVEVMPLNFGDVDALARSLEGAAVLFNTYWIRFPGRGMTFERAVANSRTLLEAAKRAGVPRLVHISITNASEDSRLRYFLGKGIVERAISSSGISHAIVRPALIFGSGDILINNIAWLLRKFPFFAIPGAGDYRLQPVFVEDLARIAIDAAAQSSNLAIDAVGPEVFRFNELVDLIARTVGGRARIVHVSPELALFLASIVGRITHDMTLTRDEIRGLMADLLISDSQPTAPTRLSEWLQANRASVGASYASELALRSR